MFIIIIHIPINYMIMIIISIHTLSLHTHAGLVETYYTALELKVNLHPTQTCPEFLVSCWGVVSIIVS